MDEVIYNHHKWWSSLESSCFPSLNQNVSDKGQDTWINTIGWTLGTDTLDVRHLSSGHRGQQSALSAQF